MKFDTRYIRWDGFFLSLKSYSKYIPSVHFKFGASKDMISWGYKKEWYDGNWYSFSFGKLGWITWDYDNFINEKNEQAGLSKETESWKT